MWVYELYLKIYYHKWVEHEFTTVAKQIWYVTFEFVLKVWIYAYSVNDKLVSYL